MSLPANKNFLAIVLVFLSTQCLFAQERSQDPKTHEAVKTDSANIIKLNPNENLSKSLTLPLVTKIKPSNSILEYRLPFSTIFKYDTSPNNPQNECYEITKPLTKKYTFLFNFMSQKQYTTPEH